MSTTTVPFSISNLVTECLDLLNPDMTAGVTALAMIPTLDTPVSIANAIMSAASGLIENHPDGTRALIVLTEGLEPSGIEAVTRRLKLHRPLNGLRYVTEDNGRGYLIMKH